MILRTLIVSLLLMTTPCVLAKTPSYAQTPKGKDFIADFTGKFGYSKTQLQTIFSQVYKDDNILRKISRPAEKNLVWHQYRKLFLDEKRIQNGINFYRNNRQVLQQAYEKYGVSPYIITAIIGVETRYGKVMGKDQVITALATIAFEYPKREEFFTKQLQAFLQMAAQEKFDPLQPQGSYAGAMGMAQFMPSSFLNFAIDYDGDGKKDLWHNAHDAIFSVAHYLAKNGWQKDQLIIDEALLVEKQALKKGKSKHKPFTKLSQFKAQGIFLKHAVVSDDTRVGYLRLAGKQQPLFFVTFANFAAITTYNTSPLYAMAVTELAQTLQTALTKKT